MQLELGAGAGIEDRLINPDIVAVRSMCRFAGTRPAHGRNGRERVRHACNDMAPHRRVVGKREWFWWGVMVLYGPAKSGAEVCDRSTARGAGRAKTSRECTGAYVSFTSSAVKLSPANCGQPSLASPLATTVDSDLCRPCPPEALFRCRPAVCTSAQL